MATLVLGKVWINRLSDGAAVSALSGRERQRGHEVAGEVRTYASGRQRSVAAVGERSTFAFSLRAVSLADIETLRGWVAVPVLVRDHRGQAFSGVFFKVTVIEQADLNFYDVAITLSVVSV
jgi:hypothetical protein